MLEIKGLIWAKMHFLSSQITLREINIDQAGRPLPPKSLNILVGATLKLDSLCITVSVVENIWTLWFVFRIFCVVTLERFVLVRI